MSLAFSAIQKNFLSQFLLLLKVRSSPRFRVFIVVEKELVWYIVLAIVMNKPSRLEQKAQSCIDKGEYYEAHQVYRTLYFRMTQQEKYVELLDVLHSGCKKMAEVSQFLGSIDLAELYAETLMKGKIDPSEKVLNQIAEMIEQFLNPSFSLPSPDAHTKFISTCVKW
ncbi:unnamed protein product [Cylicostephanus goldi]|uniref:Uncharacterized protein n=1 Tax=Cylicostephanus goldi TaxID=71465 RepID=A0A3P6RDW0_CYLGO|nr:unnamed protein product [Cylicostephanus goldi]